MVWYYSKNLKLVIHLTIRRAATTAAVLHSLDQELVTISSAAAANKMHHDEHERALSATLKDVLERQKDKSGMGMMMKRGFLGNTGLTTGGDKDGMDVDDPIESAKGKNRKCVFFQTSRPLSNTFHIVQGSTGSSNKATKKTEPFLNTSGSDSLYNDELIDYLNICGMRFLIQR
jgi:hypothetical protein